jgi:hypothetical protein
MGLDGSLDGIISELNDLLARAERTAQQAEAEVKMLRAMLKAAGVIEPEPKSSPRLTKPIKVSDETHAAVLEAIVRWDMAQRSAIPDVPGSFTVGDLEGIMDAHVSSIRNAIAMMRNTGEIRAVGKVPHVEHGTAPMAYALEAKQEQNDG